METVEALQTVVDNMQRRAEVIPTRHRFVATTPRRPQPNDGLWALFDVNGGLWEAEPDAAPLQARAAAASMDYPDLAPFTLQYYERIAVATARNSSDQGL